MMVTSGWLGGHPESGELLCYADRGLSVPEHEMLAAHLQDCEHCQRELHRIQSQARAVSAALGAQAAVPVSDIRKAQAWQAVMTAARRVERRRSLKTVWIPRLAAASLVLVFGAIAAGPGLAFVRTVLRSALPEKVNTVAPVVVIEPAAPVPEAGSSMNWRWTGPSFVLELQPPASGLVEFRRGTGRTAAVQVVGASSTAAIGRRGTNTIVVTNDGSTSPLYIVSLPSRVTQVTISSAGQARATFAPECRIRYQAKELAQGRVAMRPNPLPC